MTQHIVSSAAESGTTCCADGRWRCVGERKIRNRRKPDLRGRKDANDMIIKNTHKIILDMIFIIDDKTISDIIRNQEHINHAGYYFYLSEHYQMERAGWMKKGCFHSAMNN
ncbi:TPA: hypothetical protein JZF87_004904 [Escherichia coli]|nr:hypothetical protein [Escherichia coli]HAX4916638.1 hypothetical protein [Escherichia coli]